MGGGNRMNNTPLRMKLLQMILRMPDRELRATYFFLLGLCCHEKMPVGVGAPASNEQNNSPVLYSKGE